LSTIKYKKKIITNKIRKKKQIFKFLISFIYFFFQLKTLEIKINCKNRVTLTRFYQYFSLARSPVSTLLLLLKSYHLSYDDTIYVVT